MREAVEEAARLEAAKRRPRRQQDLHSVGEEPPPQTPRGTAQDEDDGEEGGDEVDEEDEEPGEEDEHPDEGPEATGRPVRPPGEGGKVSWTNSEANMPFLLSVIVTRQYHTSYLAT